MGKVVITVEQDDQDIDVEITSKDIGDAISKLIQLKESKVKERRINSIRKFRGIAKYHAELNDEEWYNQ